HEGNTTTTERKNTGTTKANQTTLGEDASNVSISSSKGHFGHLLGAAGGVEAIASLKALENQFVPATLGLENPDKDCDLDYTPQEGKEKELTYALSNSLGFGGHNAVLCFKRWEGGSE